MKALIQRVKKVSLSVKEREARFIGQVSQGLLVFIGVEESDSLDDLDFLVDKIVNLRIFEDDQGKMNLSIKDKNFEIMCIPNFTLAASVRKGRRPSFDKAAVPQKGREFFDLFCSKIKEAGLSSVEGVFGAEMIIEAVSYGPVNIILDSNIRRQC
ncbi:MAG: D-tyrosyl-tRNA(Tyr) deacylase [Candidatus Omnitrophica bacterium]|nr:D-tyrosyl-tRNA(Tyr) deacylase [Candidatus Omnitrophota bacterium]